MEWLGLGLAAVFSLLGLACVALVAIGLPGTWLMLVLGAGTLAAMSWLGAATDAAAAWWTLGVGVALALVGEVVETAAGAAGSQAGGGSRRGMVGAVVGGFVGGIAFTPLIPIPLVGTLIGAMIGTFAGALIGERSSPTPPGGIDSVRAATGATLGRLVGSMGKTLIAAVLWAVLSLRLLLT
jgi:uncharacterized protein YqgC (DUF456 family)